MNACVVGAGAIGGFIGARLAAAGDCRVSAAARGATLAALRSRGWRLRSAGSLVRAPVRASEAPAEPGVQDVMVIAVKGPALTQVARHRADARRGERLGCAITQSPEERPR